MEHELCYCYLLIRCPINKTVFVSFHSMAIQRCMRLLGEVSAAQWRHCAKISPITIYATGEDFLLCIYAAKMVTTSLAEYF